MSSQIDQINNDENAVIDLPSAIMVSDLADQLDVGAVEVVKALMRGGYMFSVNDVIEQEIASVVCQLFGFQSTSQSDSESTSQTNSIVIDNSDEDPGELSTRPPIVTILGHVDHGKTTLLDSIRKTNVVDGESGGITQHIAAYQINHNNTPITFLDTPGHEAFTAMRARGAQVTDIAILVVASDDGVMPQTVEAIDHVRAADVPIIVAITKKDLPNADLDKVHRQLSERDLLIEDWGGDIIAIPISGITGEGVPELLENIQLVAEISELKANPTRNAIGVVVEARKDKSKGNIATILVQTGTLNQGDILVVGKTYGKIRAMFNDQGDRIKSAIPSTPVEVMGLNEIPEAGSIFTVADNDRSAKIMIDEYQKKSREETTRLQDAHTRNIPGELRQVDLIIKTDVQGTIEPVKTALENLNSDDSRVNIIHIASGGITERDVLLAVASDAVVVGFRTPPEGGAESLAKQEGVEIREYDVIYHLVEDINKALEGLLEPNYEDIYVGRASVRAVFNVGRRIKVAGIFVNDGKITRESKIRVLREGAEIFMGPVSSLKHFKDDVREVGNGFEGGVSVDGFNEFEEDDVLEAYNTETI
jgi:translation initiation factor IF-2